MEKSAGQIPTVQAAPNLKSSPQAQGSPATSTCTWATSQDGTECSAPTSSTFDEVRSQPPSAPAGQDTAPATPDQTHVSGSADRQPPSPLAAAADEVFPLVPYLSTRPDDRTEGGGGGEEATSRAGRVDGILVGEPRHGDLDLPRRHERRRRRRRQSQNVAFATVTVHHHPHALGDNPAVSDGGVPVGLAWASTHVQVHDVDDYEYDRQMAGNERRSVQQLRMNGAKRRMLLRKVGHTDEEMDEAMAEVRRVQTNRARTMGGGYGIGGALFDMGSKTKMVRDVGTKAKRQVGKVVVAMDKATTIRIQPIGMAVLDFGQVDGCGDLAPADP